MRQMFDQEEKLFLLSYRDESHTRDRQSESQGYGVCGFEFVMEMFWKRFLNLKP